MFHDEVVIQIKAGKGGDGSASFRREKYIPKGGPDGGDGGKGGDVYIVGTRQMSDLNDYASTHNFSATNGVPGSGQKLFGKNGEDLTIKVPVGTRIFRKRGEGWQLVVDVLREGHPFRLLVGGRGGLGNVHFATSTNQAPKYAQPGEPGQAGEFKLELQLIADVGIIGLPNAGKSTFLSVVSDAKPKIANYPFTTLSPVLGVVKIGDVSRIFADIPGLISGASQGKGLGHQFLRHVQRTKVFVHLIDALQEDYVQAYQSVRNELIAFDEKLATYPELVVITKSELLTDGLDHDQITRLTSVLTAPSRLFTHQSISAATRQNLNELLFEIEKIIT